MVNPFRGGLDKWVWALMILLLPITSMPLVARLTGSDVVAAPSGLVLFLFILVWLIPYLLKNGGLPRQIIPLLAFVLVAVLATAAGDFISIPLYKSADPMRQAVSAFATLAVGVGFFVVSSSWPSTKDRLAFTLRLVNWSGLIIILWALVQAAAWYSLHRYPQWMRSFHEFYSVGTLFRQRFVAFALEPSWLAHQLNMLYLPFWMASVWKRYTAHKFHLGPFHLEDFLFAGGILIMVLTLSRVGLLAFLLTVGYLAARITWGFTRRFREYSVQRWPGKVGTIRIRSAVVTLAMAFGLLLISGLVMLGAAWLLSRLDHRMANLFNLDLRNQVDPVLYLAERLSLSARMVYWKAGWNVFNQFPLFGVGLGHAGFFLPGQLDGFAQRQIEVLNLIFRWDVLLNIKSIWVRILAETGVVGFSVFAGWLTLLWKTYRFGEGVVDQQTQMFSWAGQFVLIAFLLEGFSVDTFALPYVWLSVGLSTAAAMMNWRQNEQ